MTTNSWVMAVGVRLHGLALARATAMAAIPAAVPKRDQGQRDPAAELVGSPVRGGDGGEDARHAQARGLDRLGGRGHAQRDQALA